MKKVSVSEVQQNIDLLKELPSSSICILEGWSTPVEEAIWHLEDYIIALQHIEEQKEEIYKQNALIGELISK
jgi:hypothetical protein